MIVVLMFLLSCIRTQADAGEIRPEIASSSFEARSVTATEYQSAVMDTRDFFLVGYKDSTKAMPSILQDTDGMAPFAIKLKNYGFHVVTVDCATEKKACKFVQSTPSFQMFVDAPQLNPYTKKFFRQPLQFEGSFDKVELKDFERSISQLFPSNLVKKLESQGEFENYVSGGNEVPTVVLFSTKSTISLVYRSIAFSFKGRMNFVFSSVKGEMSKLYEVTTPKIGVFGIEGGPVWYEGSDMNSRSDLVAYLTPYAKEEKDISADGTNNITEVDNITETVFHPDLSLDAMPDDEAWLLTVVRTADQRPEHWAGAMKSCVGRIKCAVLLCESLAKGSETFGQKICSGLADRLPVYVAIRQGVPARKKLRDTEVEQWKSTVYSVDDHKKVIKLLGESLPESSVRPVTEFNIWEFVSHGTEKGLVSIVLVSNSDQIPGLYRNLALSVSDQAQFGFMNMPSPDFTRAIGNKLPAVIAIPSPTSSEEAESKGVQIINYNPEILGPFSFVGLHQFVEGVYKAFAHTFPTPERPAAARSRTPQPPPETPPPLDEGPIVTDSEESNQEAEELLREIQREEDARAAQLKEEMEEERKAAQLEAAAKKKKKKKGKKSMKKKESKSEL